MEPQSSLHIEYVGEVTVARFAREVILCGAEADSAAARLTALLAGPGPHQLLLDFGNVHSLSSLMLSKLLALNRATESGHGRLTLCNLRPAIREIFDITRLSQILYVYPGEREALASFQESSPKGR
jgi:anti-anti-sigma factor